LIWRAYVNKRGSLNVGRRVELSTGLLTTITSRINGGKAELSDFAPHEVEAKSDIAEISKAFGGVVLSKEEYKSSRKSLKGKKK